MSKSRHGRSTGITAPAEPLSRRTINWQSRSVVSKKLSASSSSSLRRWMRGSGLVALSSRLMMVVEEIKSTRSIERNLPAFFASANGSLPLESRFTSLPCITKSASYLSSSSM